MRCATSRPKDNKKSQWSPSSRIHTWQMKRLRYNLCLSNRNQKKEWTENIHNVLCRMEVMLWRAHKDKQNGRPCDWGGDELKTRLLAATIPGARMFRRPWRIGRSRKIMFTASINRHRGIPEGCPRLTGESQCLPQGVTPGMDKGCHDINSVARNEIFLATFRTVISVFVSFLDEWYYFLAIKLGTGKTLQNRTLHSEHSPSSSCTYMTSNLDDSLEINGSALCICT